MDKPVKVEALFYPNLFPSNKAENAERLGREFGFELESSERDVNNRGDMLMVFTACDPDPLHVEWFTKGLKAYDITPEVKG